MARCYFSLHSDCPTVTDRIKELEEALQSLLSIFDYEDGSGKWANEEPCFISTYVWPERNSPWQPEGKTYTFDHHGCGWCGEHNMPPDAAHKVIAVRRLLEKGKEKIEK